MCSLKYMYVKKRSSDRIKTVGSIPDVTMDSIFQPLADPMLNADNFRRLSVQ